MTPPRRILALRLHCIQTLYSSQEEEDKEEESIGSCPLCRRSHISTFVYVAFAFSFTLYFWSSAALVGVCVLSRNITARNSDANEMGKKISKPAKKKKGRNEVGRGKAAVLLRRCPDGRGGMRRSVMYALDCSSAHRRSKRVPLLAGPHRVYRRWRPRHPTKHKTARRRYGRSAKTRRVLAKDEAK